MAAHRRRNSSLFSGPIVVWALEIWMWLSLNSCAEYEGLWRNASRVMLRMSEVLGARVRGIGSFFPKGE